MENIAKQKRRQSGGKDRFKGVKNWKTLSAEREMSGKDLKI